MAEKKELKVLSVDVGGTNVKILATGQTQRRRSPSGPKMTPKEMVEKVKDLASGWDYDVVSIGYPGPVRRGRVIHDPINLGKGWVGFNFEKAFGRPVKLINDAAMQAMGSYRGGAMLFLGLGTGLGSAMIIDGHLEGMELAHLPYRKHTYEDYVGLRGIKKYGRKRWRKYVFDVVDRLAKALEPDDVVLGGGNVKLLDELPPGAREGDNMNAFLGGYRLWEEGKQGAAAKTPRATRRRVRPDGANAKSSDKSQGA